MKRVGIYSGTFDPVHPGHVAFALGALEACGLDRVVFLPEHSPRGKSNVSHINKRVDLLRESLTDERLSVARLTSERFTVKDTLPEIQSMFKGSELVLLVGSDIVRTFTYRWDGLEALLRQVSLAIGMRGDDSPTEISAIITGLEKDYETTVNHTILHCGYADMASSQIRLKRLAAEA
jgi:nicotinate-nucleotide adenylyltransferase